MDLKEFQSKGGKTTSQKHKDKLAEWGRKGGNRTKEKYGLIHYANLGKQNNIGS